MENSISTATTAGGAIVRAQKTVPFDLAMLSGEMGDAYMEELNGLGNMSPDILKIPSGGGLVYEVPTDDPENPDLAKTIDVVVVHHHPVNAYWIGEFSGDNAAPDCASNDGHIGVDSNGEVHCCEGCPRNEFGSDGVGKACKNMHKLYMLREGDPIPLVLSLPPSALRAYREFITRSVIRRGLYSRHCVIRLGLKKETSKVDKATGKGGIVYSSPTFTLVGALPRERWEAIDAMAAQLKAQQADIAAAARTVVPPDELMPVDMPVPFDEAPPPPEFQAAPQAANQPTFYDV